MESNDSPEIPDKGETSDIPGLFLGSRLKSPNHNQCSRSMFTWHATLSLKMISGGKKSNYMNCKGRYQKDKIHGSRRKIQAMVSFSSYARILGECSTIRPPLFWGVGMGGMERRSRTLIPLFMPGSVHSSSRAQTTAAECSLTSCVWARFRIGSQTRPGQRHNQPTPTSLDHGCMRVLV